MIKHIVLDWHGVLDLVSPMTLRRKFIKIFFRLVFQAKFSQAWHILQFSFDIYSSSINEYAAGKISPVVFWSQVTTQLGSSLALDFRRALMEIKINTELIVFLKGLSNKYDFYILSDCPLDKKAMIEKSIPKDLKFKSIYYSCDFHATKRDHNLFKIFLEQENINPQEILFVDDSYKNIKIAKQFNIKGCLYRTNQSPRQLDKYL